MRISDWSSDVCSSDLIRERLRGENDARVFLSQRLQPFAQLTSKRIVIECEPTLVDDEECWSTVEPIFDAVKEIAKDCRCGIGADQSFGLEGLDVAFSEMLGLGVEQPSVRTAHTIRPERLFEFVRLKQDGKTGQRALRSRRGSERTQRRPEVLFDFRCDRNAFPPQNGDRKSTRPE